MDEAEAEERDDVGAHAENDDAHDDRDAVSAGGADELARHNGVDRAEAQVHHDVEQAAELGAPDAIGVTTDRDLPKSGGCA